MREKKVARVVKVSLGKEDHNIFTFYITLDFGGVQTNFGGYALDEYDKYLDIRKGTAAGMDLIMRLMDVFEATSWEKIVGKVVYVLYEGGEIVGFQSLPFNKGGTFSFLLWKNSWGWS